MLDFVLICICICKQIKLLEEEIDELNLALKECREENEQQIIYERNRSVSISTDVDDLQWDN